MSKDYDHINSLNLQEGDTYRGPCPVCGAKNTFTAKKEMGFVIANCYKASCSYSGRVFSIGLTAEEIKRYIDTRKAGQKTFDKTRSVPLVLPEYVVTTGENPLLERFFNRWPVVEYEVERYDVRDRRAVFFVRHNDRIVDAVGRSLNGVEPKWLRYGKSSAPYTKCLGESNGKCVVVEDIISAITIAYLFPNTTGVALLGTNLTDAHLEVLQEYNTILVALDPDASLKSIEMKRNIELWTGIKTYAMSLLDDPKYQVEADIKKMKELLE